MSINNIVVDVLTNQIEVISPTDFGIYVLESIIPPPPPSEFKIELTTINPSQSITIPHQVGYVHNYTIDYGDGSPLTTVTSYNDPNCTHVYTLAGVYEVKISGTCETFNANFAPICPFITKIIQWSNVGLKVVKFANCSNLTEIASDGAGLSLVTNFITSFYNTKITSIPQGLFNSCVNTISFQGAFGSCSLLSSIPSGLFDNNTLATSFYQCFYNCPLLTSIPSGLFNNNTLVTSFYETFYNCPSLISIPSGLFSNNTQVNFFNGTFEACTSLTGITSNLFDNNTAVLSFASTFSQCAALTSIPSNLFDFNTAVISFENTFSFCTALTSIPSNLFDFNTAVTNFNSTFKSSYNIPSIPSNLFNNNTLVTDFTSSFDSCYALTGITSNLFDFNSAVTSFANTFSGCWLITEIPSGLINFTNNPSVTDFTGTFIYCSGLDGSIAYAPDLWNSYPSATGTDCFQGDTTNNFNYYGPTAWGCQGN